jgi:hypothetical protein
MPTSAHQSVAVSLYNNRVMASGGLDAYYRPLPSCEEYDATSGQWTRIASLHHPRYDHSAVLLEDGRVMVLGGYGASDVLSSVELFDPILQVWHDGVDIPEAREMFAAVLLEEKVYVIGGCSPHRPTSVLCFDLHSSQWTVLPNICNLDVGRNYLMACTCFLD